MIKKPPVHKVIAAQCVVAIIVITLTIVINMTWLVSIIAGLLIAIVPYSYFALRVFRYRGAKNTAKVTQSFYRAEAGKFVMNATGFTLAFVLIQPLQPVALFLAYGLMILIQILGARWLIQPAAS